MNNFHKLGVAVSAATLFALSACAGMSPDGKSEAVGAGIGAVGGAVLTGGSPIGTVGGAAVGAVVGHEVGKQSRLARMTGEAAAAPGALSAARLAARGRSGAWFGPG